MSPEFASECGLAADRRPCMAWRLALVRFLLGRGALCTLPLTNAAYLHLLLTHPGCDARASAKCRDAPSATHHLVTHRTGDAPSGCRPVPSSLPVARHNHQCALATRHGCPLPEGTCRSPLSVHVSDCKRPPLAPSRHRLASVRKSECLTHSTELFFDWSPGMAMRALYIRGTTATDCTMASACRHAQ